MHWDTRADNIVLTPDRFVVVDWGQARRGVAWMDHAMLALDCSMSGSEISTAELARTDPTLRHRDPGRPAGPCSGGGHVVRGTLHRIRAPKPADPACHQRALGGLPAALPDGRTHLTALTTQPGSTHARTAAGSRGRPCSMIGRPNRGAVTHILNAGRR